jgi:two-component system, chemotaxis family, chemotaxis protein CheY
VSLTIPVPFTKRRHILIVDDDPDIVDLLADVLVDAGYSVNRAGDGAEALEALDSTPTDAVLLDLHMPGMNGQEFLGRRAADPRLAKIPVIIISGSAQWSATTVGTFVLAKPMDIGALLAMLGRCHAAVTRDNVLVTDVADGNPAYVGVEDITPADVAL